MAYNTTYVGTQIGNYRVTSQLASGGFGSVYLAQHIFLSGRIAVFKVLHAVYLSAPHERESFFQEAQLLEKLKHAYIIHCGKLVAQPVHTPPIRDVRQTPLLQNKGQNNAYSPGMAGQVATKPTGGDRVLAVLCYLSHPLLIAYSAGLIFILLCYFAGKKRLLCASTLCSHYSSSCLQLSYLLSVESLLVAQVQLH